MDSLTDLELVRQIKSGNLWAFEELVKKYQKKTFYICYRMTRDFDAADDIAQETFIRVYQSIANFKEKYQFHSWLYRICTNLCINYLRRQKFLVRESDVDDFEQFVESHAVMDREINSAAEQALLENLRDEIDRLPPDYKAVLILKVYENLSCEEIAGILKIPLGTVLSRLARAREKLAQNIRVKKEQRE